MRFISFDPIRPVAQSGPDYFDARRNNTGVKRRATQPLFYGKETPTTERSNAACGASA
jgi:hypothetical protein